MIEFEEKEIFHISDGDPSNIWDKDKIISKRYKIDIVFTYPLGGEFTFTLKCRGLDSITKERFASFVQETYHKIYKNEDKYGIWGHNIEDLVLEGASPMKDGKTFELHIGS